MSGEAARNSSIAFNELSTTTGVTWVTCVTGVTGVTVVTPEHNDGVAEEGHRVDVTKPGLHIITFISLSILTGNPSRRKEGRFKA